MLFALLSDVALVGTLQKKRDHFVVICIDQVDVAKSEKKYGLGPLRWEQEHTLQFRPSSKITMKLFLHNINPLRFRRPYQIGQHTCNITQLLENDNLELELTDNSTGRSIPTRLAIKLTIIHDLAKDITRRVDADLAAAGLNNDMLASISADIEDAIAISRVGSDAVKVLGSCVEPLGKALKLFVEVTDSVADAHPIVKASWTVLSDAYKVVREQKLQDENVVSLAESLREMLRIAGEVPDLTVIESTPNVVEMIGRISLEVALLIDEYTRYSFGGRVSRSQITDDIITRIGKCQQDCWDVMEKFRATLVVDISKDKTNKDNILAKEISTWLNAPDSSQNYHDACKKRQESTGSWFIDSEEFSKWKDNGGLLCIYGNAGCGKTVLCSSVITHVVHMCKENESSACAYFFFDGRDAQNELQRYDGFIRSLVRQFWVQNDGIPAPLEQLYGPGDQQPSTEALEDVLQQVLRGFTNSYIIIDSLDGCIDRRELLTWVNKTSSSKAGKLHLLVTSRPEEEIETDLQPLDPASITLGEGPVNDDIRAYIDSKMEVGRLSAWPEEVRSRVKDTLMAKARGLFRWLALQLEELQNCLDVAELYDRLEHLPEDLDETYSRVLGRIPEQRRARAKIFLRWIAFSARPPSLEELCETAAIDFGQDDIPNYDPLRRYQPQDVLAACSSLITESEGYVKLAHMSVKEYLVSDRIADGTASYFSINEKLSHSIIAKACLAYLLHFDSSGPLEDKALAAAPLAKYAARNWVFHVRSGGGDDEHVMTKLIVALLESTNPLVNWIRLWDPENLRRGMQPRILSTEIAEPLYYASLLDLAAVSRHLLDSGASVNPKRTGGDRALEKGAYMRYGTALQAACHEGHVEMVKLLLYREADVNLPGGEYGCALQAAACQGDKTIVELLLDRGADVNVPGGKYNTALQAAAWRRDEEIVKILLDRLADVNTRGGEYGSALQAAAWKRDEASVKILLDRGADVNMRGGEYGSPLQAAAWRCDEAIVRLLLESGADVNMLGGKYGSALQATACQGDKTIVELLLKGGADVNIQGGIYGSALQAAACQGDKMIVALLLENGADVNMQGGKYGSALQAAVFNEHNDIKDLLLENLGTAQNSMVDVASFIEAASSGDLDTVKSLLEKGVDVNISGGALGSPLFRASLYGHLEIVRLLLDNGADVNRQGGVFGSPLQTASVRGHKEIVELLLENSADVNAPGGLCGNALLAASVYGHDDVVELLLENGADVNARANIQLSSFKNGMDVMAILRHFEKEGDVHSEEEYSYALHVASYMGHTNIVKTLLDHGADVNAQGGFYDSALRAALAGEEEDIEKLLLQHGATPLPDIQQKND